MSSNMRELIEQIVSVTEKSETVRQMAVVALNVAAAMRNHDINDSIIVEFLQDKLEQLQRLDVDLHWHTATEVTEKTVTEEEPKTLEELNKDLEELMELHNEFQDIHMNPADKSALLSEAIETPMEPVVGLGCVN